MELVNVIICAFLLGFSITAGYTVNNRFEASIKKFPFQVSVEVDSKPICGGAILGDQWVLTANTCIPLNVSEINRVKIRAGADVVGHAGTLYSVSKMVRYFFGSYFGEDFDIGLIKVAEPFSYGATVQWARPAIDYLSESHVMEIAGWGLRGSHHRVDSSRTRLQSAKVKMISESVCKQKFEGKVNITKSMACLVPASPRDNACIGDVGSPVAISGLVSGIVANNKYCWQKGYPLVVTDIGDTGFFLTFTMAEPIFRLG